MFAELALLAQAVVTNPHWYEILKWWGPILAFGSLIIKAYFTMKKSVGEFLNSLLHNHLAHIQDATALTVTETQKTNTLLAAASLKDIETAAAVVHVKDTLEIHHEKETQVWSGILNTLTVLEDRTRRTPRPRRRKS